MDYHFYKVIILPQNLTAIEECLARLVAEGGARCAFVLARSGEMLAAKGDTQQDNLTALGALLAGAFASSREVARLLREQESDFVSAFYQGVNSSIFKQKISSEWTLIVLFGTKPHIGLVRALSNRAADKLQEIYERCQKTTNPPYDKDFLYKFFDDDNDDDDNTAGFLAKIKPRR